MNPFTYAYPVKTYFGKGAAAQSLPGELAKVRPNVLLAYGGGSIKRNGVYTELTQLLEAAGKTIVDFSGIMSNPTYEKSRKAPAWPGKRKSTLFWLWAVVPSSTAAKSSLPRPLLDEDIWDYEYSKKQVPSQFIPMGAVVTAFGTGAEMNNGAVITHEAKKSKSPLTGSYYRFAILDPAYTLTMPLGQVISGAFDSLSHCMETYLGNPRTVNLSDEINEACQRNIIRNIRQTLKDPQDIEARSELVWAAMAENGILKIGKQGDFQCHMLEHQLGAYTNCNHGKGLAVLHPVLYRHYLPAAVAQFARLATNVWQIPAEGKSQEALAEAFLEKRAAFIKEIGLPTNFRELGIPCGHRSESGSRYHHPDRWLLQSLQPGRTAAGTGSM